MRRGAELALTATHDMNQETLTASPSESVVVELTAVVVAVTADEPRVLTVRAAVDAGRRGTLRLDALPAGPLQSVHRTLDQGLRAYVALFGAIAKGKRRYIDGEKLAALDGIEIRYTGQRLDQGDLDVWESVLHVVRTQALGGQCRTTSYALLKLMGKTDTC